MRYLINRKDMTLSNGVVLPTGATITDTVLDQQLSANPRLNSEGRKKQLLKHGFIVPLEDDKGRPANEPTVQEVDPLAGIERKGRWYYPVGSDKALTKSKALEFVESQK